MKKHTPRPRREFKYGFLYLSLLENAQDSEWPSDFPGLIQLVAQCSSHVPAYISPETIGCLGAAHLESWRFSSCLSLRNHHHTL